MFMGLNQPNQTQAFLKLPSCLNGNSRSSELCCLIIIHAFCRYITQWTKRKMLDTLACDFYCVTCGVPMAYVDGLVRAKAQANSWQANHFAGLQMQTSCLVTEQLSICGSA